MKSDVDLCREHMNGGRLVEALAIARKLARAAPKDVGVRGLLIEVLFSKGEHASVETELSSLEREQPGSAAVKQLRTRFKKRR